MKTPRVTLDWAAYFKTFVETHGEPVRWGRRLLFRDGWLYAALDHRGPEWKPPDDPATLAALKRRYWEMRLALILAQRRRVESDLRWLDEIQRARDCPLQERRVAMGENGLRGVSQPLDCAALAERLVWLATEQAECVANLETVPVTE